MDLAERFHSAFTDAMAGSPFSEHVTHHSIPEIRQMKHIHLSDDNKSGYLIKDHGDGRVEATGLFNQSEERGRGRAMLQDAVHNHGVNYVEAYGPKLPKLYNEVGFHTHEQHPFDDSMASPHWDYERHGRPDYHIMHLGMMRSHAIHIEDYDHDPEASWYHGSPRKFQEFKDTPSTTGDWNTSLGTHFSSEEDVARSFGKNVHHVQLKMQNPKVYPSESHMDHEVMMHEFGNGNSYSRYQNKQEIPGVRGREAQGWATERALHAGDFERASETAHHWISNHPDRKGITNRFRRRLQDQGHDGIVYGNDWEKPGHASAIVFDTGQIQHTSTMVDDFRWAQDAQNRRAEQFSGGNKTESDSYYGKDREGDQQEKRLNFKDWLKWHKTPEEGEPHEREYWSGHDLGSSHGQNPEHADFDEMDRRVSQSTHPDHFFKGYTDGFKSMNHTWDRVATLIGSGGKPYLGMRVVAHVSGNQIDVLHCPFCGAGAVIARSDATIECGFCTSVFTVQTQPQYNGFPQSVSGQPYQWPGMPQQPGVVPPDVPPGTDISPDPGMGGSPVPPGPSGSMSSDPADVDDDDSDDDDDDDKPAFLKGKGDDKSSKSDKKDDKKKGDNPFAKKKSYRTVTGALVDEPNYLAHLAILHAKNKDAVAAKVRAARGG